MKQIEWVINRAYKEIFQIKDKTDIILFGGAGSGKSYFIAQKILLDVMNGNNNYLVVRKVSDTITNSCFALITGLINKYDLQDEVADEDAEYGVEEYTQEQLDLHIDIMRLLKSKKHEQIMIDDCMIVFGRVYSIYVLCRLKQLGKLDMKKVVFK